MNFLQRREESQDLILDSC